VGLSTLDNQRLTILRRDRIGFVFQAFNLVPTITAAQNITLPLLLASRPEIIFADGPTGNLDSRTGAEVLTFLRRAVDEMHQTIVMVTHDPVAASYADRIVFLADGRVVDEMQKPTGERVLERMKRFGE
jgi:putative ABC transport system ATP-binding protein